MMSVTLNARSKAIAAEILVIDSVDEVHPHNDVGSQDSLGGTDTMRVSKQTQ